MWETIQKTLTAEFSDLSDVAQLTQLVVRLLLGAVLGGLLGWQRERHGKAAGIRTHMLVATSSALFVLVPQQIGMDDEAVSRVMQGLLAGIGFLCAGAIIKMPAEEHVRGLTTAAGVWMTAAIGLAVGLGRETTAVVSTLVVFTILQLERPLGRLGVRREDDSGQQR